ncbi:hypothetical protein K461DRAFT_314045 [Myriangium duriaei CBS 260.36]|uniref:Uncharacterized protein n=1 Tax=Myriangium duriaei CBS 260.36 TaxID=1168546 RepID=A0A9P4IZ38_9PEZI|nr:hypothetical protein K461DRAFT_314045 [Myriangium duriaei CBS 260.36]
MSTQILRDRDINAQATNTNKPVEGKHMMSSESIPQSTCQDYEERLKDDESSQKQAYVSPSDAIMSPASKKLSDFKQKQINKQSMPRRSLFAKAVTARQKDLGPA